LIELIESPGTTVVEPELGGWEQSTRVANAV